MKLIVHDLSWLLWPMLKLPVGRRWWAPPGVSGRFQAPGEQVEIVKSESQPHLNGLQGYVDFSHSMSLEGEAQPTMN